MGEGARLSGNDGHGSVRVPEQALVLGNSRKADLIRKEEKI